MFIKITIHCKYVIIVDVIFHCLNKVEKKVVLIQPKINKKSGPFSQ